MPEKTNKSDKANNEPFFIFCESARSSRLGQNVGKVGKVGWSRSP